MYPFDNINEYLNVLQSVQLPFAMLPTFHFAGTECDLIASSSPTDPIHFAASTKRLGRFASSAPLQLVSTALSAIVLGTNLTLIWSIVDKLEPTPVVLGSAVVGGTLYFGVCARLVWEDLTGAARRLTDSPNDLLSEPAP